MLSKDHFANLVNFVAGKCAQRTVENTVKAVVAAWGDEDIEVQSVADKILEAVHHPFWANGSSDVQEAMFQEVKDWFEGLDDQDKMISSLTKAGSMSLCFLALRFADVLVLVTGICSQRRVAWPDCRPTCAHC